MSLSSNKQRSQALDTALKAITPLLMANKLTDVRLEDEKLIITPLTKLVPDAAEKLSHQVYQLLPRIRLTDLLIEVDAWTNFSEQFTHLNTDQTAKQKQLLLSTILADAINLGHTRLAEACPSITAEQLSWMSQWYLRPETYQKALAVLVNFQHQLPLAQIWGDGTTSSSDGQSFPIAHHRPHTAHINLKYGLAPTVVFYTHISDQYAPYHTKVISSIVRDAPHLLDGLLYHESNLAIREHYTDTAGFTDQVFAMCHLLGFNFAPRIRNLKDHKLFSILPSSTYPELKPLLSKRPINLARIEKHWDDILRLVHSIRLGTVPASLILGKLAAYPRQNGLALAVREIGRIERTLFALEWLQNPHLRRRVQVGLNKGEARNGLAREVFKHRLGRIVDRSYQDQWHKASGLNLVVAAIILWNTVYLTKAVAALQQAGRAIPDTLLPHLSPLGWEHINMIGEYHWNLQLITTLEKLKPLRLQLLKPELPSHQA